MARYGVAVAIFAVLSCAAVAFAQGDKSKRASPPAKAECQLTVGKTVVVEYSSPRVKGRKIYGGLVPFGEVWRTGANEATSLVTPSSLKVGEKEVPAGSYTLFTIPGADRWTLIVSKKTGEWGIPYPGEKEDLVRTEMRVTKLPSTVENFTVAFEKKATGCTLSLDWESTRASVDIAEKK